MEDKKGRMYKTKQDKPLLDWIFRARSFILLFIGGSHFSLGALYLIPVKKKSIFIPSCQLYFLFHLGAFWDDRERERESALKSTSFSDALLLTVFIEMKRASEIMKFILYLLSNQRNNLSSSRVCLLILSQRFFANLRFIKTFFYDETSTTKASSFNGVVKKMKIIDDSLTTDARKILQTYFVNLKLTKN